MLFIQDQNTSDSLNIPTNSHKIKGIFFKNLSFAYILPKCSTTKQSLESHVYCENVYS